MQTYNQKYVDDSIISLEPYVRNNKSKVNFLLHLMNQYSTKPFVPEEFLQHYDNESGDVMCSVKNNKLIFKNKADKIAELFELTDDVTSNVKIIRLDERRIGIIATEFQIDDFKNNYTPDDITLSDDTFALNSMNFTQDTRYQNYMNYYSNQRKYINSNNSVAGNGNFDSPYQSFNITSGIYDVYGDFNNITIDINDNIELEGRKSNINGTVIIKGIGVKKLMNFTLDTISITDGDVILQNCIINQCEIVNANTCIINQCEIVTINGSCTINQSTITDVTGNCDINQCEIINLNGDCTIHQSIIDNVTGNCDVYQCIISNANGNCNLNDCIADEMNGENNIQNTIVSGSIQGNTNNCIISADTCISQQTTSSVVKNSYMIGNIIANNNLE